ncbi:hypothetical protein PARHAE_00733 [Paracoccus haematequi]|uniref:Uncharacterized protein n=1 Tax=Paracoccus haematequi TaxID=2491866 RepID=A0A3S4EQH8_9RHOB|nr:hypothetical protein [Paracoccus haematequi]VDS07556.1 hypothetical protein PARHAE_00733 [Paracoccus haematequi]
MTDAGIHWFEGLGFRPAVWSPPHRADGVDYPRLIVAPDADVPLAKVDPYAHIPASGYAWGTWIPADAAAAPQIASPSTQVQQVASSIAMPPYWPPQPSYPCRCITPPVDVPPVAPVPVPASGVLLIVALVGLGIIRGRRA